MCGLYWCTVGNKNDHLELGNYEECIDCCLKGSCDGTSYDIIICVVVAISVLGNSVVWHLLTNRTHPVTPAKVISIQELSKSMVQHIMWPPMIWTMELMLAIHVAKQPIAMTVDASHSSFQFYKEGVYCNSNCLSMSLDHTMLAVGFGTENGQKTTGLSRIAGISNYKHQPLTCGHAL